MKINDLRYSGYSSSIRLHSLVIYSKDPGTVYRVVALQDSLAAIRPVMDDSSEDILVPLRSLKPYTQ